MRILFLTHRVPYAPNRGDRVRAFHILQFLARRAEVDVISLAHDRDEARHVDAVRAVAASARVAHMSRARSLARTALALPSGTPLTHALLDSSEIAAHIDAVCSHRTPDVVLAYCSSMARFALQPPLDRVPMVLDLVDVDSEKWRALAAHARAPMKWIYTREARCLRDFEARAMSTARTTFVVNEREATSARRIAPRANVAILPVGVETGYFEPSNEPDPGAQVVFCGVMDYAPNERGVLWFVREVWPIVRRRRPDARFTIVGTNPTKRLLSACRGDSTIEVTGRVEDVRSYLWRSAVAVAPLWIARGTQTKVLEMVAAGLPTVITPAVAGGLCGQVTSACVVANDREAFARGVVETLEMTREQRRKVSAAADLQTLEWDRVLTLLWRELSAAARTTASDRLVAVG